MATTPLMGVTVTAFRQEGVSPDETYINVGNTTTDVNGDYELKAMWQGESYKLKFEDPDGDYLVVYYSSSGLQQDLETGSAFYLTTDLTGIDVTLSSGGSISGTVIGEV